ncbi:MAG: chitobiase/beta-hexosaminidase C-terminal domain-containing protein, partial [Muribaculaceae bacterium]|nr:chitobiase/beta-hexosaminidase C-terminal domain-containing protein [Muribaculaceae bacterium]
ESKLYVIGEINGKSWAPNDGVEMTLADGAFSADITVSGAAGFFSFVTDLAENNDQGGWDYVNELRYGAANDGDVASTEAANALVKGSNAYQLPTGEYTLSVKEDLSEFTVTVKGDPVPTYPDELYILGEVNENTWAPNVGLMMTPADSKSLTGEFIASFKADGRNDGYNYLSFSSKLAENADDWAAIADSRYGADANNKEVVLDEAMAIQKGENAFKIAAGEYNVEVNLSAGTVKFSAVPVVGPSAPVINPNGGTFENEVTVTITAEEADEIRYTIDGSTPDATSTLYAEPIVLNEVGTHTVKAIAFKNGLVSDAVEAEFTITDGGSGEDAKLEVILEKKDDIVASGEGRFSTGYGDYLYTTNKADGQIVRYDKTGARSVFASVEGIGVAITSDDAGNIIVNKGFPGASSATDWVIVEPDGTQHDLAITFPEAVAAARIDVAGRVIGNVMSEEGAWMFLAANTATNLVAVRIANGAQDGDALDSPAAQYALDNTTVARARYESVEEVDAATDPSTAVVYRKRGNLNIYGWDEDGTEIVNFGQPEGARSCEGFDIFKIGDVYYSVEPSTDTNYADGFAIRELGKTENIVTKEKVLFAGGSQRFQSLTARVTGGCAIIYQNVSGEGIGMYKFTPAGTGVNAIAAEGEVVATAYYNLQGVRVNNPAAGQILIKVNTLSNGKVSASKVLVR